MDKKRPMIGNAAHTVRAAARVRIFSLCSILLFISWPVRTQDPQPPASVPVPAGASAWKLIFNDSFDGAGYDTSKWNPYADWGGNGSFNSGRERYYASQIRLSNGICNLVAEPNSGITTFENSYKSGELISARANTNSATPYKFSFLYGYVEVRLRIVDVSGFFGAVWMLPSKQNYVYEWEIDILEQLGHDHRTMFQTYHYKAGLPADQARDAHWTPNKGTGSNGDASVLDYSTGYHTFGVDWQPDHLTFYIDGIASGTFPTPGTNNSNIANTPGYILIQQMVENSWIRSTGQLLPDVTTSVDTFHIDYVRVWQAAATAGTARNATPQGPGNRPAVKVSPNPMRERVEFAVTSGIHSDAALVTIYDGRSRLVRRIAMKNPVWDGTDSQGLRVKSGLYLYSVVSGCTSRTGKIVRVQ
jgi:beta-glucanase (GH16 family)